MRAQIFSDIHNDLHALRRLGETDADCYIAAGDLVSWGRGLEACGEILKDHKDKVWVLPGNHESAEQIALFCARFGFRNFHGQLIEAWRASVRRPRLFQPNPDFILRANIPKSSLPSVYNHLQA